MLATISNEFFCPERVYDAIQKGVTPMLVAVRKLGPERVRWAGTPPSIATGAYPSAWALDGEAWVEEEAILRAAGLGYHRKRQGCGLGAATFLSAPDAAHV